MADTPIQQYPDHHQLETIPACPSPYRCSAIRVKLAADIRRAAPFSPPDMRQVLHPEGIMQDSQSKTEEESDLWKKRVKLITTLKWDQESKIATVCMHLCALEEMQQSGEWLCAMWRTDFWKAVSLPETIQTKVANSGILKGPRWMLKSVGQALACQKCYSMISKMKQRGQIQVNEYHCRIDSHDSHQKNNARSRIRRTSIIGLRAKSDLNIGNSI